MGDESFFTGGMESLPGVATQKTLHMIFVVDNSGSMRKDNRIGAVNDAFRTMIPELQKIQANVKGSFDILISIMAFNEDPEWVTQAESIEYYVQKEVPISEWVTYYSRAFDELNTKLSRSQFLNQRGKMAAPYIMLMTDGAPTEGDDYEAAIDRLNKNGWFAGAQKYAVLIGDDTVNDPNARRAVSSFVGNQEEGIIDAADANEIARTVSAKTLIVADQMTQKKPKTGYEQPSGGSGAPFDPNAGGGGTIPSFPDFPDFPGFPDPGVTGDPSTQGTTGNSGDPADFSSLFGNFGDMTF